MKSLEVMSNGVELCNGDSVQLSNDVKENGNRDLDLLQDMDSYWEEIRDRLTISRMVSDSVVKGIVNAVTQEAAEKIAQKEPEVPKLKEVIHVYHVSGNTNEFLPLQSKLKEILFLSDEKKQLAQDATAALEKEKERYDLAAQELHNLRDQKCLQQKCIFDCTEELNATKQNLTDALEQNERYKADVCKLDQKLELAMKELREVSEESNATKQHLIDALEQNERYKADVCKLDQKLELTMKELCEERRKLLDANKENQNVFCLFEEKEREHKQQLESMAAHIRELWKDVTEFKSRVTQDISGKCLRGMMVQIKCIAEESHVENIYIPEIYKSMLKEASHSAQPASQSEIEDLSMEYTIMQELCALVFKEAMKDAEQDLNNLDMKYREENELRVLLEMEKLEKEKQCEVEVANAERLRAEIIFLLEEKAQLAHDATAALKNERERYELAAQELHNLKGQTFRVLKLISDSIEESNATKQHLSDALEQNERYKADVCRLDQKLELAMTELCEERRMLLDANKENQNVLCLFEAKEREHKQQLESMAMHIRELLKAVAEFQCRVTQDITLYS